MIKYLLLIALSLQVSPLSLAKEHDIMKNVNQSIENIPLLSMTQEEFTIKSHRKEYPLYLKFWASWCIPCQKQMPHLQQAYEKYSEKVKFLAVNVDINDSIGDIQTVINTHSLTVPMAIDQSGELTKAVDLVGTPLHVLMNTQGEIVYKGHDASTEFDNALAALSKGDEIAALKKPDKTSKRTLELKKNTLNILLFTTTWCDSYLKESRPTMSQSCINAQKIVSSLYKEYSEENWVGIISRLWTGQNEVEQFKGKYDIRYPLLLDESNEFFSHYKVKNFPTLILVKKGKEVFRTGNFNEPERIQKEIRQNQY